MTLCLGHSSYVGASERRGRTEHLHPPRPSPIKIFFDQALWGGVVKGKICFFRGCDSRYPKIACDI